MNEQRICSTYTVGYYSATRKKEMLPFAVTWMDLQSIMLSGISQTEKDILYDLRGEIFKNLNL